MTEQKSRYALITGASSGIGYEFANLLAKDGVKLVITSRNEARLKEVKTEIENKYQIRVKVLPKDLSNPAAPSEIFSELEKENIGVDILVNNAGFNVYGMFSETDLQKELEMIQVHITSLTHLTKLFLKKMLENKTGKILNIASIAAFVPGPLVSVHFATRAYVLHFSEALANELKGTGVSVTCLCPGPTESAFYKRADMVNVRLATGKPIRLMDARTVAEVGYMALKKGKTVAIPGFRNKLLAFFARFAPRKVVTKIVRWLMGRV